MAYYLLLPDATLCDDLINTHCPKFFNALPPQNSSPKVISNDVLQAFSCIHDSLHLKLKDAAVTRDTVAMVQAAVLLQLNQDAIRFEGLMEQLFSTAFNVFNANNKDLNATDDCDQTMENELCKHCQNNRQHCCCNHLLRNFELICKILSELKITNAIASSAVASVLCKEIKIYINEICKSCYDECYLEKCLQWTRQNVIAWLRCVFGTQEVNDGLLAHWMERLEYLVHLRFAETRIYELFEIIVEYPDSQPAVKDLKECMTKTDVRKRLVATLQKSFDKRLLQPAVNTADIITQYISTIKMLRYLDPNGVLLELVCLPLRDYLRQRDDTIKCVIVSLTDQESGAELAEELLASDNGANSSVLDNADDSDGEDWMPDPVDALPVAGGRQQRTADIINVLINIYGSKDMFVSEYRTLLADRILSSYSYDVSTERRYLELLKRRFGENHLNYCDIMLKDVQSSQRINRQIKTQLEKEEDKCRDDLQFDALILSSTFWPSLKEDSVEPPASVKSAMERYTAEFEAAKGMRTLEWMNNLGKVELELELDNTAKLVTCTPAQAVIITTFQQKHQWSLAELSEETGVSALSLRNRLSFWVSQGVIRETAIDQFAASKSFQPTSKGEAMYEGNEDDSFTADNQDAKDEELQVYWSYIVGMLTNIGSLSLERIHAMLKMFAMHGQNSKQCSKEEVKEFLQSKIQNGELQFANSVYTLTH